jgi:hypothetical protein
MVQIPSEVLAFWNDEPTQPASSDEIDHLEQVCGQALPAVYRDFLLRYGYSQFDLIGACVVDARYDMNPDIVTKPVSLSFISSPENAEMNLRVFGTPMELYDDIGPRIPTGMLPIGQAMAETSGLILMQLDEKNYGSLWYWERVDETWGTGSNTLLGALGRDIEDMLGKVRQSE